MANTVKAGFAKALEFRDQEITERDRRDAAERRREQRERQKAHAEQRAIVKEAAKINVLLSIVETKFDKAGLTRLFFNVALGSGKNEATGQTVKDHVSVSLRKNKYQIMPFKVMTHAGNKVTPTWGYEIAMDGRHADSIFGGSDELVETMSRWATEGISRKEFDRLKMALG